jgi:hypothetical protein
MEGVEPTYKFSYSGPINISTFQRFEWFREQLKKEGVSIALPN